MVTPNSKKSERPPHPNRLPRKRATIADMAPEEVYYRPLKPPCPWCGQTNTKFRYFNNRYRTPGTRISSYDQPRFKCLSPCNLEFILGRKNEKNPFLFMELSSFRLYISFCSPSLRFIIVNHLLASFL